MNTTFKSKYLDLRKRRATLRFMVNNLLTCYKDPTWPSATTYTLKAGNFGTKKEYENITIQNLVGWLVS